MHELSVCQSLLHQVEQVAAQRHAVEVVRIHVNIGPLSGIEAPLLQQAFTIARAGTVANDADLITNPMSVRVHCSRCDTESTVRANRLVCAGCGDWRTRLVCGDEMELARVEMTINEVTRIAMSKNEVPGNGNNSLQPGHNGERSYV